MRRLKKIEVDGAIFTIAPLTVEQVEHYLGTTVEQRVGKVSLMLVQGACDVICYGLNNADSASDNPWTPERIRVELDLELVDRLFSEILTFSKLKLIKAEESPGEAQPAA